MAIMLRRSPWHLRGVTGHVIAPPFLNSPFAETSRHWELDESGIPSGLTANGRRRSEFIVPVPPPKRKVKAQVSFFVRHAYFLGGKDPFDKLKTALKAEVDEDAWSSLYRTESCPCVKPKSGWIEVKVTNHYGDEAMRVFRL